LPRVRNCSSRESPNNAIDYFALRLLQNGLYSGGTRALNSPGPSATWSATSISS